jgi:hypothetical protein
MLAERMRPRTRTNYSAGLRQLMQMAVPRNVRRGHRSVNGLVSDCPAPQVV